MKPTKYLLAFSLLLISFISCTSDSKISSNNDLSLSWELIKNFEKDGNPIHEARFTITNNSDQPLTDNWEIYWNQSPRSIISIDSAKNIEMKRINGDFYTMKAKKGFKLEAKSSVNIKFTSGVWLIKEADGPVGVYAVFNPGEQQTIKEMEDFKIIPFTRPEQINRSKGDFEPIPTPEFLFDQNKKLTVLPNDQLLKAIPTPTAYASRKGTFEIKPGITISSPDNLKNESTLLLVSLKEFHGINGMTTNTFGDIFLKIDNSITKAEGYKISVANDKIEITGKDKAGVFYGVQTLLNLIKQEDKTLSIDNCEIEDAPAFSYRGLHVDVSRNFQSKESIMRMIDVMSRYKVNKLILCITEDEGWRLEIDGLPELTEVGSKRGHPSKDGSNLQPSYGSGPFTTSATGSGFYTRSDFKEIIKYAYDRHVDVIPLVNLPGHAKAAIESMEFRYNRLMREGKEKEALEFRLKDPEDKSIYNSAQQYNDNIVCVCQPSIYKFYEFVVDDILEMFNEAEVPIYMFHTGGDEVPSGAWTDSPVCKDYLVHYPHIKNHRNLQAHFFDRITKMLQQKGVKIGGWEEVVMAYEETGEWYTNTEFVGRGVYPNIWNNLWGLQDLGYKIANRGYPIILCNVTNFYFDLAYDKDPREPGLYWGGFNNTQDAFKFIPDNLFLSTTEDNMGKKLDPEKDFNGLERITEVGKKNIYGLQAQLWSETVRGQDMFEYYVLPKLFGFAERAWVGNPNWSLEKESDKFNAKLDTEWNRFANTLSQNHFKKLDKLDGGYNYHIPTPGVKVVDGKLVMNAAYPGMEIRYTLDGSDPSMDSKIYEGPIDYTNETVIAKVFNAKGRSGLSSTYSSLEQVEIPN